ncbi:DUF4221 family protein [Penaeicola halotolerans]|uniref:DUF4221 family protein n=1 Tax=Penaeicola halotolerans TaxID=2793196 RepID=UPI001CF929E1|nr:DUF4221 family protein [Penaeicola halotolerans]
MKKTLTVLLGISSFLFFACGSDGDSGDGAMKEFSLTIEDTLMIDAGDSFLDLKSSLNSAKLFDDDNTLYTYNSLDHHLDIIDLDALNIKERIKFEKEGPNGIFGTFPFFTGMKIVDKNTFFNSTMFGFDQFNSKAEKVKEFITQNQDKYDYVGDSLAEGEKLTGNNAFTADGKRYYTQFKSGEASAGIAFIDLDEFRLTKKPIADFDKLDKFNITFTMTMGNGTSMISSGESWTPIVEESRVIYANSAMNELLIYDVVKDTAYYKTYTSQLSPNAKEVNFSTKITSQEQFSDEMKKKNQQITFQKPIYNPAEEVYYRFAKTTTQVNDDLTKDTYYLTVFDRDLNMIGETAELPENLNLSTLFIKDGKLLSFINIDDEMGFVVMNIQEK